MDCVYITFFLISSQERITENPGTLCMCIHIIIYGKNNFMEIYTLKKY